MTNGDGYNESEMNLPIQDWMLKMEQSLMGLGGQFVSAKTTVLTESAALAERMERMEKKLDEVLERLERMEKG